MSEVLFLLVGATVGGMAVFLAGRGATAAWRERVAARDAEIARLAREAGERGGALEKARAEASEARVALAGERAAAAERIAALTEASDRVVAEFKALSAEALQANNARFLELAGAVLGRSREQADGDLEKRQLAIDGLVKPLRETLVQVQEKMSRLDEARAASAAALGQQLQTLAQSQAVLQQETARLSTALRSTTTAGTWGELQLRRVVELAGMSDYCDFVEQASVGAVGEERARLRPDLVVRLPGGQTVVVDAKAPLGAYREAAAATDEGVRAARLAEHAGKVAGHVTALAAKAYWEQFQPAPEFVVLFLPGDQFLAAALAADPELLDRAIQRRVLPATPATLIALLKAAAYGWRQEKAARNAEEIGAQAREFYDRVAIFADHLGKIGPALDQASKAYNAALGSLESRVLPAGRRLEELGAQGNKTLAALARADVAVRESPPISPE